MHNDYADIYYKRDNISMCSLLIILERARNKTNTTYTIINEKER